MSTTVAARIDRLLMTESKTKAYATLQLMTHLLFMGLG